MSANGNGNGMSVRVRSVVLGIILGSVPTAALGVWLNFWIIVPRLEQADAQLRGEFDGLTKRFANMVTRFDKLDAEEHTESAHNAQLTTEEKVSTALVTELAGHIHAQDGRLDSHDTRMGQQQIEITRLRSDYDGLIAASGRRR